MLSPRTLLAIVFMVLLAAAPLHAQTAETPQADANPTTPAPPQQKTLTNDSIIRMVNANLSDDLVIQAINSQPGKYTTDGDSLTDLKDAGVSERVVAAMINKNRKRLTPAGEVQTNTAIQAPSVVIPEVNEIGVYYKDRQGQWQPLPVEVVHSKSSGWLKSTVTNGIIKTDMNGQVNGRESRLPLQAPIEILIYTPEGVAAPEYTFLRFHIHSNSRDFRTMTGGVFHSTGGAGHDEIQFNAERIAPRTYTFTIDRSVGGGEFGILPPGTGNVTNGGKIYTFAVTE
ncbi:hypothetical protein [Edaphobacter flagellatus]|uniref:hypothetical protein n=1 Tax=Edaphobacter flagellatus TaxID=1933044 RepID=UPI0021B428B3|nr:hypothetical protein [Edaphobacter flagellatus]